MEDRPEWFDALADRFRFVREIGRGGMARVYLAEDIRLHRPVAIKVLREELAHALAHDRFLAEIRVAAELNHPNIVPLYDSGIIPASVSRPPMPWFAMMFIAGESLKERLARGPLPVGEAVDIARAVAAALDYAHGAGRGVIHRDIKPANILLAGDVATVADFGIARAIDRGGEDQSLTATGLTVGSPEYMSPEQAGADPALDHRTDVYSLGCVVYQMLAGHPPFAGPNPHAIIARHNLDPPPPLGTVRPGLPPGLIAAVEKALAKKPEDRWSSAGAFAHALRETAEHPAAPAPSPAWRRAWWTRRRTAIAGTAAAVVAIAAVARAVLANGGHGDPAGVAPDTTRYVVFPFTYADGTVPRLGEEEALRDALARWQGVTVEDPIRVRDRVGRGGPVLAPSGDEALRLARSLGAGRYLQGTVARMRDSLRVLAAVYDVATRRELRSKAITIDAGLLGRETALRSLADSLLLGGIMTTDGFGANPGAPASPGTTSLPALQAFAAGSRSIDSWDLAAADSAFAAALGFEPRFPQAALWLGLVRSWGGRPTADWAWAVSRAEAGAAAMEGRDSVILAALQARATGEMVAACGRWAALTRSHPRDFTGWYGSSDCLRADEVVLRDSRSPTGWRYRTSYWSAIRAFEVAFTLLPSVHRALRSDGFSAVRGVFLTDPNALRRGRNAEGTQFFGKTFWQSDSLLVIPLTMAELGSGRPGNLPPAHSHAEAIRNLRLDFVRITRGWVAAFPRSSEALEALANGMAMLGDPAASDSMARARELTTDPARALELAAQEVWLHLGTGLTGDLAAVRRSATLADSLLALGTLDRVAPGLAAGLASLTGRLPNAVALIGRGGFDAASNPPAFLRLLGPSLWAYSSHGGPADSVETYWSRVAAAIETNLPRGERRGIQEEWLGRAAAMAYPDVVPSGSPVLAGYGHTVPMALLALARGDSAAARSALGQYRRDTSDRETLAITPDVLSAEAALHWQVGDSAVAVGMLEASLADVGALGPSAMSNPLFSAGTVRALLLWAAMDRLRGRRDGFGERAGRLLWSRSSRSADEVIRRYEEVLQ